MKQTFLDTGYVLAAELANDQSHQAALEHWNSILPELPRLVTTSYVFAEIVTFFNCRGHFAMAVQVGNKLLSSPSVQVVQVDEPLFFEAWAYFQQHQDRDYSLTDCLSFLVMKKLGVSTALSFDKHFVQAGFAKEP